MQVELALYFGQPEHNQLFYYRNHSSSNFVLYACIRSSVLQISKKIKTNKLVKLFYNFAILNSKGQLTTLRDFKNNVCYFPYY